MHTIWYREHGEVRSIELATISYAQCVWDELERKAHVEMMSRRP